VSSLGLVALGTSSLQGADEQRGQELQLALATSRHKRRLVIPLSAGTGLLAWPQGYMSAPDTAPSARARLGLKVALVTLAALAAAAALFQLLRDSGATSNAQEVLWRSNLSAYPEGRKPPLRPHFRNTPWNIYGGSSITIASDPQRGKVVRHVGPANQAGTGGDSTNQRAELVPNYFPRKGDTIWWGFDLWVNPELQVSTHHQGALQLKTAPIEGFPTIGMGVGDTNDNYLAIQSGAEHHNIGPVPRGVWTRLVIGIHLNDVVNQGWVEVWRDGVNVLPRNAWDAGTHQTGAKGSTIWASPDATTHYLKFGVYRGAPRAWDEELRFGRMLIGTTRESAS
jgi:hypothetical protein